MLPGSVPGMASHPPEACAGETCPIHNPSGHHMVGWKLNIRHDRYALAERICPAHGIGHPDPDSLAWQRRMAAKDVIPAGAVSDVHGCCGCCTRPPLFLDEVAECLYYASAEAHHRSWADATDEDRATFIGKAAAVIAIPPLRELIAQALYEEAWDLSWEGVSNYDRDHYLARADRVIAQVNWFADTWSEGR